MRAQTLPGELVQALLRHKHEPGHLIRRARTALGWNLSETRLGHEDVSRYRANRGRNRRGHDRVVLGQFMDELIAQFRSVTVPLHEITVHVRSSAPCDD